MQNALRNWGYRLCAGGALILFSGCAGAPTKKEFNLADYGPYPFQSLYQPASASDLSGLNELNDDLMARYDAELEQVSPGHRFNDPQVRRKIHQNFALRNEALFGALQKHLDQSPPNPAFISLAAAESIRAELLTSPGGVGFSFGRAAYAHLLLSQRGVPSQQMTKIFVFGQLRNGKTKWKYHMATLVKGIRGGDRVWWVIDSLMPRILELAQWQREITLWSGVAEHVDVRFYASAPEKFLPSSGEYALAQMQKEMHPDYFERVGRSLLSENPAQE